MQRVTFGLVVSSAVVVAALVTQAAAAQRPGGREKPGAAAQPAVAPPLAKDEVEKKILDVIHDIDLHSRTGLNVPLEDGRLLRVLAESTGAKQVVEIGTANGYSGLWFCLALRHTGGRLITHEIDAKRAAQARENFKRAGVESLVTLVEGNAHTEIAKLRGPIDLVFIDADKEGYIDYLQKLLPLVRPGGLIVAHNTGNQGSQMPDYIKAVTTNPDLDTAFVNQGIRGIGLTLKKR
jgi:predicted O-methyltransferase YrrM